MSTQIVDDLSNAVGGYGRTVDVAAELGNGVNVIPHAVAVAESAVSAGAVQLQSGVAGAGGITWTNVGAAVNLSGGAGVTLNGPGAAVALIRAVITATVVGGKCVVVITS
jgi:hypothetical protein